MTSIGKHIDRKEVVSIFNLGVPELILILALIVFGPGKLPDVGRAVGRALKEFRRASRDLAGEMIPELNEEIKQDDQRVKKV